MIFNPLFIDSEAKQINHIGFANSKNSYLFRDIIKVANSNQFKRSFNSNSILENILKDMQELSKTGKFINTNAEEQLHLILSGLNISSINSHPQKNDTENYIGNDSSFIAGKPGEVIDVIKNALKYLQNEFNIEIEHSIDSSRLINESKNENNQQLLSYIASQLENNCPVTIHIKHESANNYYMLNIESLQNGNESPINMQGSESIYLISLEKVDSNIIHNQAGNHPQENTSLSDTLYKNPTSINRLINNSPHANTSFDIQKSPGTNNSSDNVFQNSTPDSDGNIEAENLETTKNLEQKTAQGGNTELRNDELTTEQKNALIDNYNSIKEPAEINKSVYQEISKDTNNIKHHQPKQPQQNKAEPQKIESTLKVGEQAKPTNSLSEISPIDNLNSIETAQNNFEPRKDENFVTLSDTHSKTAQRVINFTKPLHEYNSISIEKSNKHTTQVNSVDTTKPKTSISIDNSLLLEEDPKSFPKTMGSTEKLMRVVLQREIIYANTGSDVSTNGDKINPSQLTKHQVVSNSPSHSQIENFRVADLQHSDVIVNRIDNQLQNNYTFHASTANSGEIKNKKSTDYPTKIIEASAESNHANQKDNDFKTNSKYIDRTLSQFNTNDNSSQNKAVENSPIIINLSQKTAKTFEQVNQNQVSDFVNHTISLPNTKQINRTNILLIDDVNVQQSFGNVNLFRKDNLNIDIDPFVDNRAENKEPGLTSAVKITYYKLSNQVKQVSPSKNPDSNHKENDPGNDKESYNTNTSERISKTETINHNNEFRTQVNKNVDMENNEPEKPEISSTKVNESNRIEPANQSQQAFFTRDIKTEHSNIQNIEHVKVRTKETFQPELNSRLVEEISDLVISDKKDKAIINLEPAELGRIRIAIEMVENKLTARLEVENTATKEILHHQVEFLRENLQSHGIQLSSLTISLSNHEQRNSKAARDKKKETSLNNIVSKDKTQKIKQTKSFGYNTYEFIA